MAANNSVTIQNNLQNCSKVVTNVTDFHNLTLLPGLFCPDPTEGTQSAPHTLAEFEGPLRGGVKSGMDRKGGRKRGISGYTPFKAKF